MKHITKKFIATTDCYGECKYLVYSKGNITGYELDDYPDMNPSGIGYFYTHKKVVSELISEKMDPRHPFIFDSEEEGKKYMREIGIDPDDQKLEWVPINIHSSVGSIKLTMKIEVPVSDDCEDTGEEAIALKEFIADHLSPLFPNSATIEFTDVEVKETLIQIFKIRESERTEMKQRKVVYDIYDQDDKVVFTAHASCERDALCKFIAYKEDLCDISLYKNLYLHEYRLEYTNSDDYFYARKRIDFNNTKIVIETKNGTVYINGEKCYYSNIYKLATRDKILISVASAIDYEPANCLVLDDVDWDVSVTGDEGVQA